MTRIIIFTAGFFIACASLGWELNGGGLWGCFGMIVIGGALMFGSLFRKA